MNVSKPKKTRAKLQQEVKELKGQLASTYHFANLSIEKCSTERLMASGVLLELTFLGGAEAVLPVVIRDGLSKETIEAIKKDLKRSYDIATQFKL